MTYIGGEQLNWKLAYEETGIGEKMFYVYNQRILIVIFDSARVFDPGGEDLMDKESQSNLIPQYQTMIHPNIHASVRTL